MDKSKSSKTKKTFMGGLIVIVALLAIMSFQIGALNRNIATLNAALLGTAGGTVPSADNNAGDAPSAPAPSPTLDMEELIDDDAVKGDPDAPVTIVEWSDYECPFCTRFYEQTLSEIQTEYIDKGLVKFVYRDFPLSFHPNAQKAAEAAECAGEQGKYFEMHDALFDNGVSGGVASFKQFAADIGLNTADFNTCLDSGSMASEVAADMAAGQAAGIRGTPGFIINGRAVSGAQPFANFKAVIDAALAE
jgi:protein-disulfide isomerase